MIPKEMLNFINIMNILCDLVFQCPLNFYLLINSPEFSKLAKNFTMELGLTLSHGGNLWKIIISLFPKKLTTLGQNGSLNSKIAFILASLSIAMMYNWKNIQIKIFNQ